MEISQLQKTDYKKPLILDKVFSVLDDFSAKEGQSPFNKLEE